MSRAVFVSPHLDDVAFSCGGTLAALSGEGWETVLVTCFTASVAGACGFALACQTDKGLAPDVDYMALRRDEDRRFAATVGVRELVHLPYPEAPHRGYESAPALFAGVRADDLVSEPLAGDLTALCLGADLVALPQGLGGHVDHVQVLRASAAVDPATARFYRDVPYALRVPAAGTARRPRRLTPAELERKLDGCAAYASQLNFQFGGEREMRAALTGFAHAEGVRTACDGPAEVWA